VSRGITVAAYESRHRRAWDDFITSSKNGVFLFYRDYMDYHADRFPDASLVFLDDRDALVAVLPATATGGTLSSHAGLTFGGMVCDDRMRTALMLDVFAALIEKLQADGRTCLRYKAIPHIYHRVPAEEDLYALYRCGARLVKREATSSILLGQRLPFSKGRRWAARQAKKRGVEMRWTDDFDAFMAIEAYVLRTKYGLVPVHTAAELRMLAGRFPRNISLLAAYLDGEMIGGVVMYDSACVAHAQYMAATDKGKAAGALDLLVEYLLSEHYTDKRFFDFGISTENHGRDLNAGLIANKEGFGARTVVHDLYELPIASAAEQEV
jgi:hypothetical protein